MRDGESNRETESRLRETDDTKQTSFFAKRKLIFFVLFFLPPKVIYHYLRYLDISNFPGIGKVL